MMSSTLELKEDEAFDKADGKRAFMTFAKRMLRAKEERREV